jgi:hypothetical protein
VRPVVARRRREIRGPLGDLNAAVAADVRRGGAFTAPVLEDGNGVIGVIGDLHRSVIRTVRPATAEVDRRGEPRAAADLTCQIEWPGHPPAAARLANLSKTGARLTGVAGLDPGMEGRLRIDGLAETIPFVVRNIDGKQAGLSLRGDEAAARAIEGLLTRLSPSLTPSLAA